MSETASPTGFCPYLATREDPATRCGFATPANVCYRTSSGIYEVPLERQNVLCLTGAHRSCPLYLGQGLPEEWGRSAPGSALPVVARSAGRLRRLISRGRQGVWLIPTVVAAGVLLLLLLALVRQPPPRLEAVEDEMASGFAASTIAVDGERRHKVAVATAAPTEASVTISDGAGAGRQDSSGVSTPVVEVAAGGEEDADVASSTPTATATPTPSRAVMRVAIQPTRTAAVPSPTSTPVPVDLTIIYHLLQPYQSVDQLARLYRVSVQQILSQNGLERVEEVRAGEEVQIPVPPERAAAVSSVPVNAVSRHVVQEGEYMHLLADRYGTTVEEILRLNPWGSGVGLYPGRVLFIPVGP